MNQKNSIHWPELEKFYNWQKPAEEATTDKEYYLGTAKKQLPRMELALKVALRRAEKLLEDPERIEIFNARVTQFYELLELGEKEEHWLITQPKVEDFLITPQKIAEFKQRQFTVVPMKHDELGSFAIINWTHVDNSDWRSDKAPIIHGNVFVAKHSSMNLLVSSVLHEVGHNATNIDYTRDLMSHVIGDQSKNMSFNHMCEYVADLFADICSPNFGVNSNLSQTIINQIREKADADSLRVQLFEMTKKDNPEKANLNFSDYRPDKTVEERYITWHDPVEFETDNITHPATRKRIGVSKSNIGHLTMLRTNRYIEDMYGVSADYIAKEAERYNPKPKVAEVPQAEKPDWVEQTIIAAEAAVPDAQKTPSLLMRFASNAWQVLENKMYKLDQKAKDFSPYSDIQEDFKLNKAFTFAAKVLMPLVVGQQIVNPDENPAHSLLAGAALGGAVLLYAEAKEFLLKRKSNKRNQAQTVRPDV